MQTIFELCTPRDEVLQGELSEDTFAARLKDVIDGSAEPVYGNAQTFFENTYPTSGLKTLLNDSLGRLVGSTAGKNAVIRLETAFGGGKTHNLIALYHAARGNVPRSVLMNLLDSEDLIPAPGDIKIAAVVGSDLDPTVGISHPEDRIKTLTLWGELAYQLGGRAGYELIRESEESKVAVGTGLFETLIGDKPTLIMLDEIARYLRAGMAVPTKTKRSTLADQTVAFLMSLLEFAASKERCLVVLTLASEADAFSSETELLHKSLSEVLQISGRQERVLTPTIENEIPSIVTHRLFKTINRQDAEMTFSAYHQYYQLLFDKNADLPQRCLSAEYQKVFQESFPFHPELLTTLNRKTATIPNFNQTRGALRLLAWTVRNLWKERPYSTWLIHLHHIDLSISQIADDLTGRLNRPKFKQVVEADITSVMRGGMPAHAQVVDESYISSGKPPYAQRTATTIFIHSLTQGTASGVDPANLILAVITPDEHSGGDEPAVIQNALERLYKKAWFLEYDGHRYRFKTEPSLNKIIEDETAHVGLSKTKAEIERRIRLIWKKGFLQPVYFPTEPADIDDDADLPKMAILHFDAVKVSADQFSPPDTVKKLYERSGSMQSFRIYQNNVIFLIADVDQVENMVQVTRRYLAVARITGDPDRMSEFNKEQRDELKKMLDTTELDVRVAITKAYRYLYYPTQDAKKDDAFLNRETLPAQDQGMVDKDQTNVVIRILRSLKKIQTADDETISAIYIKSRAWEQNQVSMATEDLRKAFARKIGLRFLLDIGQLRKSILNGVKTDVWIYYDSREEFGYDKDSPPPAWQISEDTILYIPEEAKRLNIRIKGKWKPEGLDIPNGPQVDKCPVCGFPIELCICGVKFPGDEGKPNKVTGHGIVAQAFQQILDQCQEHEIRFVNHLVLKIDGSGRQTASNIRALGLAIPQFGKGKFNIHQEMLLSFSNNTETFQINFKGGWDRYKRLKAITDPFSQEADELKATFYLKIDFDHGLEVNSPEFLTLRDILITLEMGHISIEAAPQAENII